MQKKYIYIIVSLIILFLIAGVVGWSIFIGQKQQEINQEQMSEGGFFGFGSGARTSGGGSFGEQVRTLFGSDGEPSESTDGSEISAKPVLTQIYNLPTAGFTVVGEDTVRFVDRATGHVFEKDIEQNTTTRLDQTTIPKVYEAFFLDDGGAVLRRYLDDDMNTVTHYAEIRASSETKNATILENVLKVATKQAGKTYASLEQTDQGVRVVIAEAPRNNRRTLATSALTQLQVEWVGNALLLTQKASELSPGSSFILEQNGVKSILLSQKRGLLTLPRETGNDVLYSSSDGSRAPKLSVISLQSKEVRDLDTSGIATKCAWSTSLPQIICATPKTVENGITLSAWYRGEVHFNDTIVAIDTDTGFSQALFDPETEAGVRLDIVDIEISPSENTIFFKNKTDQTLWALTLRSQVQE